MDTYRSCDAVHRPGVAPHPVRPRAAGDEVRPSRPRGAPGGRDAEEEGLQGLHVRARRARNRGNAQRNGDGGHRAALGGRGGKAPARGRRGRCEQDETDR